VTVEDGVVMGGAGSAVVEWASDHGFTGPTVVRLGLPDTFVEHGSQRQLHDEVGIGPDGLVAAALRLVGRRQEVEAA
jgi:1-deoxy-D-xylulose-5-phosphate synthase